MQIENLSNDLQELALRLQMTDLLIKKSDPDKDVIGDVDPVTFATNVDSETQIAIAEKMLGLNVEKELGISLPDEDASQNEREPVITNTGEENREHVI